jgi:predicted kinase
LYFKTPEEFFQIPWRCKSCNLDHPFDSLKCNICEASRPETFKNGNVLKENLIRSAELRLSDIGEKLPSHANNRDCVFDNCYDRLIKKHVPLDTIRIARDKEIVLLVGPICCGKSTLARDFLSRGYCVISDGDVTKQALPTLCSSITDELLRLAESKGNADYRGFIIDSASLRLNQNRSKWVALANKLRLGVRCILFDVPKRHCIMLNTYRQLRSITHNNVFVTNKIAKNETKDSTFFTALGHSFNEVNDNIPNNSQGFVCVTTIGWTPLHQNANIDIANKPNHMSDSSSISVLDGSHNCSSQPDTISPVLFSYYY